MRSKKALANIIASLALQFVTIICGLITPRLIIETFGSSANGVVSSVSQFLGYIFLLESGIGGVVQAALYKPLANHDVQTISGIVKATERFFRIIAIIFIGYLCVVAMVYPLIVNKEFEYFFTFTLVLIIGASTFVQYYFGMAYQIVLQADQRGYTTAILRIFTTIINTILVIILIKLGANIHIVKLGSVAIYIFRPILINTYVVKKYKIMKNCAINNNAIKQRWDGLGHHIAYFLHNNTDIVVLTLFANVKEVSVYSVYFMVVAGIAKLTSTFSSGLEAAFGNMIAKNETDVLNRNFRIYEFVSYTITTILFTSTALLIIPFVSVYTKGITDANYDRPLFAYVLTAAEAIYCVRFPYHSVVIAAGHFKQTRNGAFAEAFINIILSVVLVNFLGVAGVAIGTLCAMLFRTIQYAVYLSKHILKRSIMLFVKRNLISAMAVFIIILIVKFLPTGNIHSYGAWCRYAVIVTPIAITVTFMMNAIFYGGNFKDILSILRRLKKRG